MINIGLLGYGYWGPILSHCFEAIDNPICAVADRHSEKKKSLRNGVAFCTSPDDILNDPSIDAVVVALPTSMHYETCKKALLAGKHVLVEKPITSLLVQAEKLAHLADRMGLTLMVDHHFVYKKSVRALKQLADDGTLGELYSYRSSRANLGVFRRDDDVIWDLAPHDLSILKYILEKEPVSVNAVGAKHVAQSKIDEAYIHLFYDDGFVAHLYLSWTSPEKLRDVYLNGSKGVAIYDDNQLQYKLRHCDVAYDRGENDRILCRRGDWTCNIEDNENTLAEVAREFLKCINTGKRPLSDGLFAQGIVRTIEAIEKSIRMDGAKVDIS